MEPDPGLLFLSNVANGRSQARENTEWTITLHITDWRDIDYEIQ